MTDPIGQSQVIPYLIGLAKKGYFFHIISCEKKKSFIKQKEIIQKILNENNIQWHPISYTKNPPVISTLWDLWKMKRKSFLLHKKESFKIVHCRSYIASLIGLMMKRKFKLKFIFDMRGFWVDERVEGNIWNLKKPVYKIIYNYFKKKENEFFASADYTVSLTEAGTKEIHSWKNIPNQPIPVEVIPCCVDTELFSPEKIDKEKIQVLKSSLKISGDDFVISYLGSIGTWYLLDEMLDFFALLSKVKSNSKFLFITNKRKEFILECAKKKKIEASKIIVQESSRYDVPIYLSLSNVSIFFIKPMFSKKASSPTKQGEIMSMGIPIICNSGIGDTRDIIQENQCGIVINNFSETEYKNAITQLYNLTQVPSQNIRETALKYFSIEKGIEKYAAVYEKIISI